MDENKHPVYDNQTKDNMPEIINKTYDIAKHAVDLKKYISLIIIGPIAGLFLFFTILSIITSIAGGTISISGIWVILLLTCTIGAGMAISIFGIVKLIESISNIRK